MEVLVIIAKPEIDQMFINRMFKRVMGYSSTLLLSNKKGTKLLIREVQG